MSNEMPGLLTFACVSYLFNCNMERGRDGWFGDLKALLSNE